MAFVAIIFALTTGLLFGAMGCVYLLLENDVVDLDAFKSSSSDIYDEE